ncbi:hypothetical protein RS694_15935 [Rhodoferax saidenbachensis]|uniref:Uncharacterized protein n=2 Tax=Rhodoferax saidenbachensis TaxID=1484693 RepID=A0A1P8KG28_9BURK|nr:hypothetical protein [Rhodoferax saidenbachensis]APW44921.1 hypothetical protein RS694_15935 [Rhodoferax saidenbachensis]
MGPLDLLNHLLNFMAPALAVGLVLAALGPVFMRKKPVANTLLAQAAINTIAGTLALLIGLWFFGRDGKMASYTALVFVAATSQWWAMRR